MSNNIIVGRNLLETITSALYESPIILFREYVQNSLDAYNHATKCVRKEKISEFKVEINIDKKNKKITILDNGYGIKNSEEFTQKMLNFGISEKNSDRLQYIGFRGIGRLSALPFCKTLIFENKVENATNIDVCIWQGEKYRVLLNDNTTDSVTFEQIVNEIVEIDSSKLCDINQTHYFKVEIIGYTSEIDELLEQINFKESLTRLLPIKYSDLFRSSQKIESKYKEFMNEDINDFMCSVILDGAELKKSYADNTHLLDSNIVFWEIIGKNHKDNTIGDKIGLLWFTFNKKMTATKKDIDYGIMVRSKNVLMGNNDTFASLCANSKEYVASYSELTATLRGVYGELLINSSKLKDNARREWFKTDDNSVYLKYVIIDFMKRLYKYRYAASKYFRLKTDGNIEIKKTELKSALIELVDMENNNIDISEFYKNEIQDIKTHEENDSSQKWSKYSEEDIPRQTHTKRKNYDELMRIIAEFFEKEKMYDIFIKLRAYIKKKIQ